MRLTPVMLLAAFAAGAVPAPGQDAPPHIVAHEIVRAARTAAYQGRDRGPEQTDRFSRKLKLGRDGRVSVNNISGDIVVTGGSGDEVSIDAVKRTRGDQGQLANVRIAVDDRPGRVDVRTEYDMGRSARSRQLHADEFNSKGTLVGRTNDWLDSKVEFRVTKFFSVFGGFQNGRQPPAYSQVDKRWRFGLTFKSKFARK